MNRLENFFFGRLTAKIFSYSRDQYVSAIGEKEIFAFRLFLASISMGLGKLFYKFYVLEVELFNFLSYGGLILVTLIFSFMCYFLSMYYLGL